jgi:hypothetical protein
LEIGQRGRANRGPLGGSGSPIAHELPLTRDGAKRKAGRWNLLMCAAFANEAAFRLLELS